MTVLVVDNAFNPWQVLQDYQASCLSSGQCGATSVFVGNMRDFNAGDTVIEMCLEHYPGMTEKQLSHIIEQAKQQWQVLDMLIMHRVGRVTPNETLVLVAAWASHRGDAIDATRYAIETLKHQAPFWKKEVLMSGEQRWVSVNTNGYAHTQHDIFP